MLLFVASSQYGASSDTRKEKEKEEKIDVTIKYMYKYCMSKNRVGVSF